MKITHETKLKEIRQGLLNVLEIAGPGGLTGDKDLAGGKEAPQTMPKEAAE